MADLTTLANVKSWLKITTTTDDALLQRLLSAASDYIQTWLNRVVPTASYSDAYDGPGGSRLMLPNYPITAVSSVSIDGQVIPQSTSPTTPGWVFNSTSIVLRGGTWRFTEGVQNISVSYTAGYPTVPSEIEQACIELVSRRYKERDRIGVTSKTLAAETISYSQKDMSEGIATTLKQYRKVVPV